MGEGRVDVAAFISRPYDSRTKVWSPANTVPVWVGPLEYFDSSFLWNLRPFAQRKSTYLFSFWWGGWTGRSWGALGTSFPRLTLFTFNAITSVALATPKTKKKINKRHMTSSYPNFITCPVGFWSNFEVQYNLYAGCNSHFCFANITWLN